MADEEGLAEMYQGTLMATVKFATVIKAAHRIGSAEFCDGFRPLLENGLRMGAINKNEQVIRYHARLIECLNDEKISLEKAVEACDSYPECKLRMHYRAAFMKLNLIREREAGIRS